MELTNQELRDWLSQQIARAEAAGKPDTASTLEYVLDHIDEGLANE